MVEITSSAKVFGRPDNGGLRSLIALGRDTGPVMADIAAVGESSTRMRFRTETGPDGQKWKPSLRAPLHEDKHQAACGRFFYANSYRRTPPPGYRA